MSKNYLLGFTILFLTACGGSSSGSSGSSSTGPINAAPVISSGNTYSVAENTTAIGSVAASDADGDALNYVLTYAFNAQEEASFHKGTNVFLIKIYPVSK